jgi:hypothetical protein
MRTERQRYKRLLEQKDFMLRAERRSCERRAYTLTGMLRELERSYRDVENHTKSLHRQQRSLRRGQAGDLYIQFQNIARSVQQREQIAAHLKDVSERVASLGAKIRSQRKLEEIVADKLGKVELLERQDSKGIESQKLIASALRRKLADQQNHVEGKEYGVLLSDRESPIQPAQVVSEVLRILATPHHFQEQLPQVGRSTAVPQYPNAQFTSQKSSNSQSHTNVHCQYQLASSREHVDIVATLIAPGQVQVHLITSGSASSKLIRTAQHRLKQIFSGMNTTQVNFSVEERKHAESQ